MFQRPGWTLSLVCFITYAQITLIFTASVTPANLFDTSMTASSPYQLTVSSISGGSQTRALVFS